MAEATLHFVCASGLSALAIARWGVAEPEFSHVDIVLPDGSYLGARDDAIGGKPPGVQIRPPGYEKWIKQATVKLPCDWGALQTANDWALGEVGKKYDEDAILGIILGQRWHKKGAWICSAFAGTYGHKLAFLKDLFLPAQQTAPNMLFAMCGAAGAVIV